MHRHHTLLAVVLALVAACSWPAAGQAPRPIGAVVFEGARVITGDGSAPIEDAAFVVENSRITAVGRRGDVAVPTGVAHVDLSGKTVMPAIVDAHGHPGFLDAVTGQMSKANFTREKISTTWSAMPITASRRPSAPAPTWASLPTNCAPR